MALVLIQCPRTGHRISTGIEIDPDSSDLSQGSFAGPPGKKDWHYRRCVGNSLGGRSQSPGRTRGSLDSTRERRKVQGQSSPRKEVSRGTDRRAS